MSRSNYLQIRLSEVEQASYKRLADKYQLSVAEWARNQLNWIVKVGEEADSVESENKAES